MARMSIAKKHHLPHKKAKEAAQKVADDLKARYDLAYAWRGNQIDFSRPGLSGTMVVRVPSASTLTNSQLRCASQSASRS